MKTMNLFKFSSRRTSDHKTKQQQQQKKKKTKQQEQLEQNEISLRTAALQMEDNDDDDYDQLRSCDSIQTRDYREKKNAQGDSTVVPALVVTCYEESTAALHDETDSLCCPCAFEDECFQESSSDLMPICELFSSWSLSYHKKDSAVLEEEKDNDQTTTRTTTTTTTTTDDCSKKEDAQQQQQQQQKIVNDIELSLCRLESMNVDLQKDLYHQTKIMTLRVKTENPLSAVQVMRCILMVEAQRERILRATFALQQWQTELQGQQQPSSRCSSSHKCHQARLRYILSIPPPRVYLSRVAELYEEAKVRVEAQHLLRFQQELEEQQQQQRKSNSGLLISETASCTTGSASCFFEL